MQQKWTSGVIQLAELGYHPSDVLQFLSIFIETGDVKHTPEPDLWLCSLSFATLIHI